MSLRRVLLALSVLLVLAGTLFLALRSTPSAREDSEEREGEPVETKQARAAAHFAVLAAERHLSSGELPQALVEARRAHALAPSLPAPHRVLAAAHQLSGDERAACAEMRRYVEKAESPPEVRARLLKSVCADAG